MTGRRHFSVYTGRERSGVGDGAISWKLASRRAGEPVFVGVVVTRLRVAVVLVDVIAGERILSAASATQ